MGTTAGDVHGSVFALSPRGRRYSETTLYEFSFADAAGWEPLAPVTIDASGALYGTTARNGDCAKCGAIFKLVP